MIIEKLIIIRILCIDNYTLVTSSFFHNVVARPHQPPTIGNSKIYFFIKRWNRTLGIWEWNDTCCNAVWWIIGYCFTISFFFFPYPRLGGAFFFVSIIDILQENKHLKIICACKTNKFWDMIQTCTYNFSGSH